MPPDVPLIVVSATLAPATIDSLARLLHFRPGFKTLNLGNVRKNIFWEVRVALGSMKKGLPYLRFLLPEQTTSDTLSSIPSTIVFVTNRFMAARVADYLRGCIPEHLRAVAIMPLHAKSKPGHISRVLQNFDLG